MKKVIIFGAKDLGRCLYEKIHKHFEVLFFVDNGNPPFEVDLPVYHPNILPQTEFDLIYIASAHGCNAIYHQLVDELHIPAFKINKVWGESHIEEKIIPTRIRFLEDFAEHCYQHHIEGSCAEVGVCTGAFSAEINRVFSDRTLYLFDTFDGFDSRDLEVERAMNSNYPAIDTWIQDGQCLDFRSACAENVIKRLPFPDKAVIKQGFFPQTFDLDRSITFSFVNLDTDLYQPIKDGLEIFYPRMTRGGVILVHDYYSMLFGVTRAVNEFVEKYHVPILPIGDYKSIAIVKV